MRRKRNALLILASALTVLGGAFACSNSGESQESELSSIASKMQVEYDVTYHSEQWDNQVLSVIGEITEYEKATMVPQVDADEYYFGVTKEVDDAGNSLDLAIVRCYGVFERLVEGQYEKALYNAGYQLSGELPYGYIEYSLTDDLIVQYELKEDEEGEIAFELLIYRYEYRIDYWPGENIRELVGENVPEIKTDCYEFYAGLTASNNIRISIYAYHMDETKVAQYETDLKMAGYKITKSEGYGEAVSPSGYLTIMYEYFNGQLEAYIVNAWPFAYINEILGRDLPKLSDDPSDFSFGFIGEGEDGILTLYYDNTTLDDMTAYGAVLEREGYKFVEERQSTGELTITTRDYEFGKDEHALSLMYCVEQRTIAIAIYY